MPLAAVCGAHRRRRQSRSLVCQGVLLDRSRASVTCGDLYGAALLLRAGKSGCDFLKRRKMLVDVRVGVLDGDGPLFIPPEGLGEHAPIGHSKPVLAPEVLVDPYPISVVANFLRVKHQRTIRSSAADVCLETNLGYGLAIAIRQFLTELSDRRVVLPRQHLAKHRKAGGHGKTVGVEGSAVKDLVVGNQIHYSPARAEGS